MHRIPLSWRRCSPPACVIRVCRSAIRLTALVAGSWAPLIGTALLRAYDSWTPIAIYVLFAGAVSLLACLTLRRARGPPPPASAHARDQPAGRVRAGTQGER